MMKKIILLVGLIGAMLSSQAQLQVENSMTIADYIQTVLLGDNVTVSNITYNGVPADQVNAQVGYFNCQDCVLEIGSGLILSTGDVSGAPGPNDNNESANFGLTNGNDPDLLDIVSQAGSNPNLFDYLIIEFDFVPLGDSIRFSYIWASEEYSDFVVDGPTNFNDFFGFFLSGPGINGPYSNNAINLAVIPGTNIPVAIGSLNNGPNNNGPCEYCEYFNANGEGFDPDVPSYSDPNTVVFDGFTTKLTALSEVTCGETYHIKLAISDVGDGGYSSAVFLEEDSFTSNLVVQVEIEFEAGGPDNNTIFETCGDAELVFTRPISNDVETTFLAQLEFSGVAEMGVDYSNLPSEIVFDPGVFSVSVPISAFIDNIPEGQESIQMIITNIAECSNEPLQSTFEFYINDQPDPLVVEGFTESICSGNSIEITPVVDGGYAVYTYLWSDGSTSPSITVTPGSTTTYSVAVADTCGIPSQNADIIVEVGVFPPLQLSVTPDPFNVDCFGSQATATATGGNGEYDNWLWVDENGQDMFGWENTLFVSTWNFSPEVTVSVEDGCGTVADFTFYPQSSIEPLEVNQPTTIQAICGELLTIAPEITGGQEPFFYSWYDQNFNFLSGDPTYSVTPNTDLNLIFQVSDNCGGFINLDIFVNVVQVPIDIVLEPEYFGNCSTPFEIEASISGGSGTFTYLWQEEGTNVGNTNPLNYQTTASHELILSVSDNCGSFAQASTFVTIYTEPVEFTLSEDQSGTCVDLVQYSAEVTSGIPDYNYQWSANGSTIGQGQTINYSFDETTEITCTVTDFCGTSAESTAMFYLYNPPLQLYTTPDTIICRGTNATLNAWTEGGAGFVTYLWDYENSTAHSIFVGPGGYNEYTVQVADQCGQTQEATIEVEVQYVDAAFTYDYLSNVDVTFYALAADSCTDCTYLYNFGDGSYATEPITNHTFDGLDQYATNLLVTNSIGCNDVAFHTIYPPVQIYVPNAFTPDNDGVNDVWKFETSGIVTFELFIFNRWGEQIYYSTDPNMAWTGGKVGEDYYVSDQVYTYFIKYTGVDGDAKTASGTVTMLR